MFEGEGVNINADGERHPVAVLGTYEFRQKYISSKVDLWTEDVKKIARKNRRQLSVQWLQHWIKSEMEVCLKDNSRNWIPFCTTKGSH